MRMFVEGSVIFHHHKRWKYVFSLGKSIITPILPTCVSFCSHGPKNFPSLSSHSQRENLMRVFSYLINDKSRLLFRQFSVHYEVMKLLENCHLNFYEKLIMEAIIAFDDVSLSVVSFTNFFVCYVRYSLTFDYGFNENLI